MLSPILHCTVLRADDAAVNKNSFEILPETELTVNRLGLTSENLKIPLINQNEFGLFKHPASAPPVSQPRR